MIHLHQLSDVLAFPAVDTALENPNGLLAFGGDLTPERLLLAYSSGIFPWFSHGEPIMWWSPDPRGVLFTEQYQVKKTLRKLLKKQTFTVTTDHAFEDVIEHCAYVPRNDSGTWITEDMIDAYKALHHLGHAHSVEVWQENTLVGGLYGVLTNNVFCGESMFSLRSNASKVAFHYLVNFLDKNHVSMIDCQMQNNHLATLGVTEISRADFITLLRHHSHNPPGFEWQPLVLSDLLDEHT